MVNLNNEEIVGDIDDVLTEFNSYLPKIELNQRQTISCAID